jgi:hypothetical protein
MRKKRLIISLLASFLMMLAIGAHAQSNQYLHFDRVDDYVALQGAGEFIDGTNELSITGWFYTDELAYGQGYMGFRSGSGDGEFYLIQLNNGVMECRFVSTDGFHEYVSPQNTAIPQVWQHFAWVYTGSEIQLFVNGNFIGSSAASGIFSNPDCAFGIGKSLLGGFNFVYGGRIDEVSVWTKGLTADDLQDMMENELSGDEADLVMYYKFNQGEPGGDNTSITHLTDNIGDGERDGELFNFALTGETSNFNGELDPGYQAISFPKIPHHLTTDEPFELEATATSGLPVSFEIVSGPASVDGSTLTLSGTEGEVVVLATQDGDGTYDPADPVQNSFMVLNPSTFAPVIDVRNPLEGDFYNPGLDPFEVTIKATIDYPELFEVGSVNVKIDGAVMPVEAIGNDRYITWIDPEDFGSHSLMVTASSNFGAVNIETISINITDDVEDMSANAVNGVWCNPSTPQVVVEAELPGFVGAFDQIIGHFEVQCPDGGCGEWDRVSDLKIINHKGDTIEVIRYITPYGVPCDHQIDLTDYASMLQGKVEVIVNGPTLDNGYEYYLDIEYIAGTPDYLYSSVHKVWNDTYQFGDYAMLQPVDGFSFEFAEDAQAATLKLVSTGHGWGDLNTSNAAEFYEATHNIWVNGVETFEQHNWQTCNPNPDGCQPQNGTWYYNRAGWCPGSIAPWFDYNLTPYVASGSMELDYVFFEDYIDYCHPNHPDCVTGVTCDDCDDGFNPHLIVASNIVVFTNEPITTGIEEHDLNMSSMINLSPNPGNGQFTISVISRKESVNGFMNVYNSSGTLINTHDLSRIKNDFDYSNFPAGVYILEVNANSVVKRFKYIKQ